MDNNLTLYKHQQDFADRNPNKAMLVWETQTGKTIGACMWLRARPDMLIVIACPKAVIKKWERELTKWGAGAVVISRDEVKKVDLSQYDGMILDEAHDFASPLFSKERSQRAEAVYKFVKSKPQAPMLLLTATPVRSTPWNIHTLACYMGIYWDVREFRNKFFQMTNKYGRIHYEKKKGWQKMIRPYVEQIADIVLMSDCVDVPQQHHQVVEIPWTQKQENELERKQYEDPASEWHTRHRMEQGGAKLKKLKEITDGYRKIIVVCHYTAQIDEYEKALGKDRLVYVLDGRTKDQDAVIEEAKSVDDCIFIVQAQMGSGFSADEFSVVVFASMAFSYVYYKQMLGRTKVITNLHENTFIHLLAGKCDDAVYNCIQDGKDFDVHEHTSSGSTKKTRQKRGKGDAKGTSVVPEELPF